MRQLSPAGRRAIEELAGRHGFSPDAVMSMLEAILHGNGSMAQFSHPEFGGSGQWMCGGMIMLSDMFNTYLKAQVDGLCRDLSKLVASQPELAYGGGFQSQRQDSPQQTGRSAQPPGETGPHEAASLFAPAAAGGPGQWWPSGLGQPASVGAQNRARYAYFPQTQRLAIEQDGTVTVYDTLDHRITGFGQQQSQDGTFGFTSQHGPVDLAALPVVAVNGEPPGTPPTGPAAPSPAGEADVFAAIEKLAALRAKGLVTEEEFAAKKAELLGRL